MSTVFESLSLKGLRKAHLEQLLCYINYRQNDGCYYGNKEQYEKKEMELKKWIRDAIVYAENPNVKFPK